MAESIHEKVSVISVFSATTNKYVPYRLKWRGRVYKVTEVTLHNTHQDGRTLYHFFSVIAGNLYVRLKLNAKTLQWFLDEVSDVYQTA